jgi:hypothetical protein
MVAKKKTGWLQGSDRALVGQMEDLKGFPVALQALFQPITSRTMKVFLGGSFVTFGSNSEFSEFINT